MLPTNFGTDGANAADDGPDGIGTRADFLAGSQAFSEALAAGARGAHDAARKLLVFAANALHPWLARGPIVRVYDTGATLEIGAAIMVGAEAYQITTEECGLLPGGRRLFKVIRIGRDSFARCPIDPTTTI